MARVVYVGPSESVDLLDGTYCENGVPVDVPAAVATSLCEQSVWQPALVATTPKPLKPAVPEKASDA